MHATFPVRPIIHDWVTLPASGEEGKVYSFSLPELLKSFTGLTSY
jgi:hypothetical protein